jgi:actin-like ATPase involved in cell morphogenesis
MAKGAGAAGSVEAARPMGGGVIADQNVVVMNAQRISCCARF